jgi:enamine deaminase RidA (YjgF/YER057c/UK114 family)
MKGITRLLCAAALALPLSGLLSCASDDAKIEQIARRVAKEEAKAAIQEYTRSFAPVKFGFGGALEKEWSHAQAVKAGNLIFISGQQPYDTNLDAKGMPLADLETGRNFEQQLTTVLENIQKALNNYGATMDDVVFLQAFVDEKAGKNTANFNNAAAVIRKFFPKAQQSMTFVSVDNLFGPEQLIEANAIAVVSK